MDFSSLIFGGYSSTICSCCSCYGVSILTGPQDFLCQPQSPFEVFGFWGLRGLGTRGIGD